MNIKDIEFILCHFDGQLQILPRKMMTFKSNGQFAANSIEEIFQRCKEADYIDCRINAYPENTDYKKIIRQGPSFIFIDLDLSDFLMHKDPKKTLDRVLKNTLKNILTYSQQCAPAHYIQQQRNYDAKPIHPTVLWSGNGYHIYLPIQSIVLDLEDVFSTDKFPNLFSPYGKYYGYSVSEVFLKFAEEFLTNGKADPQHRPKYKTCLIRIPNTHNSKCLAEGKSPDDSKVKIIQRWNGYRLPIQLLTKDFRRWITQKEINQEKSKKSKRLQPEKPQTKPTFPTNKIDWIERLLKKPLEDHRKFCLWRIFIPYLLNVRKLSIDDTNTILINWLELCNDLKRLDFPPLKKIQENIKYVKNYLPVSKTNLKEENIEIYDFIIK